MRAGGALVLTVCAGCNQWYRLDSTQLEPQRDAAYFDAPIDAPFTCPPPGGSLEFSRLLHQIPQTCNTFELTAAMDIATAYCSDQMPSQISSGPVDGPLKPNASLVSIGSNVLDNPHLAPEGDQLFVRNWDRNTVVGFVRVYDRTGDSFTLAHDVTMAGTTWDSFVKFGRPSAGPIRRMFLQNPSSSSLTEVSIDGSGVATAMHTYSYDELGTTYVFTMPSLSSDGLRIVFEASLGSINGIVYSDRASIDDVFRAGTLVPDIPPTVDPFLTEDCARLYFSAIGNVFWVKRS
jgi:hypothetical protein